MKKHDLAEAIRQDLNVIYAELGWPPVDAELSDDQIIDNDNRCPYCRVHWVIPLDDLDLVIARLPNYAAYQDLDDGHIGDCPERTRILPS